MTNYTFTGNYSIGWQTTNTSVTYSTTTSGSQGWSSNHLTSAYYQYDGDQERYSTLLCRTYTRNSLKAYAYTSCDEHIAKTLSDYIVGGWIAVQRFWRDPSSNHDFLRSHPEDGMEPHFKWIMEKVLPPLPEGAVK